MSPISKYDTPNRRMKMIGHVEVGERGGYGGFDSIRTPSLAILLTQLNTASEIAVL